MYKQFPLLYLQLYFIYFIRVSSKQLEKFKRKIAIFCVFVLVHKKSKNGSRAQLIQSMPNLIKIYPFVVLQKSTGYADSPYTEYFFPRNKFFGVSWTKKGFLYDLKNKKCYRIIKI